MIKGSRVDREKALEIIYSMHENSIYSYILKNSGSSEEAKDIYQDSIIAFYENVRDNKFKENSAIGTYLYSIARFKWLNHLKKKSTRMSHHEKIETTEFEDSPMVSIVDKEQKAAVLDLLSELGESCKSLLIEAIYFNASMKEIATNGAYSSEQVVRNKKYKCLKKLKELIKAKPALIKILKGNE